MTISYESFECIQFDELSKGPEDDVEDLEHDVFVVINEGLADYGDEIMEIDIDIFEPLHVNSTPSETRYSGGDFIAMAVIATYAVLVLYFGIFNWQPE
ncbi:hypothetical protein JTE90_017870 [Oedothorax gibbosus]|uniref:Uncharacterized protein n=1 Tax=Oedothorax gibbosus TaxID=931172 RepID=A0AAV6V4M9_9ARAC|nr:hypothetical protein JTE90_017870 [Oedothorax gibbosus]